MLRFDPFERDLISLERISSDLLRFFVWFRRKTDGRSAVFYAELGINSLEMFAHRGCSKEVQA